MASPRSLAARRFTFRIAHALDVAAGHFSRPERNILVTGFWRSGTTWVQDVIAAAVGGKTILEPWSPTANPPFHRGRNDARLRHAWMPTELAKLSRNDRLYLSNAFRGVCPSPFALSSRNSTLESLRTRVVVKMVRAPFVLEELIRMFGCRTIHVSRHPCAIIASLLRVNWGWTFDEIELADAAPELAAYDGRPGFEKIAAYWAWTEQRVSRVDDKRLLRVAYEDLVAGGWTAFAETLAFVGAQPSAEIDLRRASVMTTEGRFVLSSATRIHSWREALTPKQIERVYQTISDVWPQWIVSQPGLETRWATHSTS